jgi:nitrilase
VPPRRRPGSLASAQTGTHAGGKKALGPFHGHRPWGHIAAQCSDGVGITSARLDFDYTEKVRAAIPVANHHVID